jgi:hypothetical protein
MDSGKIAQLSQQYTPFMRACRNLWAGGDKMGNVSDLTKAFDVINHDIPLAKLNTY